MALMWVLLFVIQASLQSALGKATGSSTNVGVFGGDQIEIQDAPYMAALFHDDSYMCAGSIIDDYFILTAAFCCRSWNGRQIVNNVHIGSGDIYLNGTTINVAYAVPHPDYEYNGPRFNSSFNNNICLLKLQTRVPFHCTVAKVDLEQSSVYEGSLVKITGWGLAEERGNYPGVLRQAVIPVVSEERCHSLYSLKTDSSFCAGSDGKDFCEGDVGAPLIFNKVQVGIASIGRRCGEYPGLYTKVSSFYNWIQETIEHDRY